MESIEEAAIRYAAIVLNLTKDMCIGRHAKNVNNAGGDTAKKRDEHQKVNVTFTRLHVDKCNNSLVCRLGVAHSA